MPNLYARATALTNVRGRIDYISSPKRQERLLASLDTAADLLDGQYWQQLAQESRAAFAQFGRQDLKCEEGREVMLTLSNSLLERLTPDQICRIIADRIQEETGRPCAVGLHLKHLKASADNLHAHIIFPERDLLDQPIIKTAERNLFFDADGKRRYKKSEILDVDKNLLPGCRIIKKGEIYEQRYFGSIDASMSSRTWLKNLKKNVLLDLRNKELKGDVKITQYDRRTGKLPQQHIPKGISEDKAKQIRIGNNLVTEFNRRIDEGSVSNEEALKYQEQVLRASNRTVAIFKVVSELTQREREEKDRRRREVEEEKKAAEARREQERREAAERVRKKFGEDPVELARSIREYWIVYFVPAQKADPNVTSFERSLAFWKEHDPYMYEDQLQAWYEMECWAEIMGGHDRSYLDFLESPRNQGGLGYSAREILPAMLREYPDSDLIPLYRKKAELEKLGDEYKDLQESYENDGDLIQKLQTAEAMSRLTDRMQKLQKEIDKLESQTKNGNADGNTDNDAFGDTADELDRPMFTPWEEER